MSFSIVVDSREKEPYGFACATVRAKLEAGDYSVAGLESHVAVERKSLSDYARTVIHERNRFAAELAKLTNFRAACVVVEADLDAVLRGARAEELRGVSPAALLGAALHITLRYHVPVFWCGSRAAGRFFTENFLRMFVRTHSGDLPHDHD